MTSLHSDVKPSKDESHSYRMEWVASTNPSPNELTATVLVFATNTDGLIALTRHPQRGWQIPGGHIEANETAVEAAERELMEEAGASAEQFQPIGYISIEVLGDKPANYKYPYPTRYCQVFKASNVILQSFTAIADASQRQLFELDQIEAQPGSWGKELLFLPFI